MTNIKQEMITKLTASAIWCVVADYRRPNCFSPMVAHTEIVGDQDSGVGAERICTFYDNRQIRERITGWEEGRRLRVEIVEGSMPIRDAWGEFNLYVLPDDYCRVTFEMAYTPKYGLLGKIMNSVMIQPMMGKTIQQLLVGLAHRTRTGQEIGKNGVPVTGGLANA